MIAIFKLGNVVHADKNAFLYRPIVWYINEQKYLKLKLLVFNKMLQHIFIIQGAVLGSNHGDVDGDDNSIFLKKIIVQLVLCFNAGNFFFASGRIENIVIFSDLYF
jgi:hypothetical protein